MTTNGGQRKGAGRPKGRKDNKTLEREKVLEAVNQRIYTIADSLLTAQQSLAKGQSFLYKIHTNYTRGPKGGDIQTKEKPVLVTDPEEIRDYLDSIDNPDSDLDPDDYYYITTKEPSGQAIDSLMNRAFGRPKESLELTGDVKLKLDV